jgi:hypothetical protein
MGPEIPMPFTKALERLPKYSLVSNYVPWRGSELIEVGVVDFIQRNLGWIPPESG